MPKSSFVDFKAVKAAVTIEQVLAHYGLTDKFKRSRDSLSGPCPIHKGSNPTQFRVSLSKNIWNCFSECHGGGNVLDFIARMENVSIHAAAVKAIEWFRLDPDSLNGRSNEDREPEASAGKSPSKEKASSQKVVTDPAKILPNKPLKFRLDKLDQEHPYLRERGLTSDTIKEFGIGFCDKGMMAGRIAIPISNAEGAVVAYVGRLLEDPTDDTPKYKFPPGFLKTLELFNLHRAIKEPQEVPLVIVEGFFDCMKLHQNGCRRVIALMGSWLDENQRELIRKHFNARTQIILALDEDKAGRTAREIMAHQLARICFVRIQEFKAPNTQPENLTPDEVQKLVGGVP